MTGHRSPVLLAAAMGTTWTLAIACMAYGMGVLQLQVAIIAPLTSRNALTAVLVGGVAFSEWRNLNLSLVAPWYSVDLRRGDRHFPLTLKDIPRCWLI